MFWHGAANTSYVFKINLLLLLLLLLFFFFNASYIIY